MCKDFARDYALGRVGDATRRAYERRWGMWEGWKIETGRSPRIKKEVEETEVVQHLAQFMAYCGALLGNQEATIRGKLVAVDFFHVSPALHGCEVAAG